jgi:hypothetical protein
MKKRYVVILSVTLCGLLLFGSSRLYGNVFYPTTARTGGYPALHLSVFDHSSLWRLPLDYLFSSDNFDPEVCRRPALEFTVTPAMSGFHYANLSFQTHAVGANYIRVNEKLTFKKGNALLLIPQVFTVPVRPDLQPFPMPTMDLPRPN